MKLAWSFDALELKMGWPNGDSFNAAVLDGVEEFPSAFLDSIDNLPKPDSPDDSIPKGDDVVPVALLPNCGFPNAKPLLPFLSSEADASEPKEVPNAGFPKVGCDTSPALLAPDPNEGALVSVPAVEVPNAVVPNAGAVLVVPKAGVPNAGAAVVVPKAGAPNAGVPNAGTGAVDPNAGVPNVGVVLVASEAELPNVSVEEGCPKDFGSEVNLFPKLA